MKVAIALNSLTSTEILEGLKSAEIKNEDDVLYYLSECASHDYKCPDKCDYWALDFFDDYEDEIKEIMEAKQTESMDQGEYLDKMKDQAKKAGDKGDQAEYFDTMKDQANKSDK